MNEDKCVCGCRLERFDVCAGCGRRVGGEIICANPACAEFTEPLCDRCKNIMACGPSCVPQESEETVRCL